MAGMIRSPYGTSIRKELDLREELNRTLYGASDEIAKGKVGLLRRMRRDSNNELIRCPCRDTATDEPSRDYYCAYCNGAGWFWDETEIVYYKNNESFRRIGGNVKEFTGEYFYIEYNRDISEYDYIIEISLDKSGKPIRPTTREKFYDIIDATSLRADVSRVEFWQVRAEFNRKWSVWYGVKNRQTS